MHLPPNIDINININITASPPPTLPRSLHHLPSNPLIQHKPLPSIRGIDVTNTSSSTPMCELHITSPNTRSIPSAKLQFSRDPTTARHSTAQISIENIARFQFGVCPLPAPRDRAVLDFNKGLDSGAERSLSLSVLELLMDDGRG